MSYNRWFNSIISGTITSDGMIFFEHEFTKHTMSVPEDFESWVITNSANENVKIIDEFNPNKCSYTIEQTDAPIVMPTILKGREDTNIIEITYTYQRQLVTAMMNALSKYQTSVVLTAHLGSGKTRTMLTTAALIHHLLNEFKVQRVEDRQAPASLIHSMAYKKTDYTGFPGAEFINHISTQANLPLIMAFGPNNVIVEEVWQSDSKLFKSMNVVTLKSVKDIIGFIHRVLTYLGFTVEKQLKKNDIPPIEEIDIVLAGLTSSRSMNAIRKSLPSAIEGFSKDSTNAPQFMMNVFSLLNIVPLAYMFDDIDTNSPGSLTVDHRIPCIVSTATSATNNTNGIDKKNSPVSFITQYQKKSLNIVHKYSNGASYVGICGDYLRNVTEIKAPHVYQIGFTGSYSVIMSLYSQVGRVEELQQLTSGNPDSIAAKLGISVGASPADLLRAVLANDYGKFCKYTRLIIYLELIADICNGDEPFNDMIHDDNAIVENWDQYTAPENLDYLMTKFSEEDPEETFVRDGNVPKFYGRGIGIVVSRMINMYKEKLKGPKLIVERIESSLDADTCTTCSRARNDPDINGWILKSCCMYICCTDCAASNFSADKSGNCRCLNCHNVSTFEETTLFINSNMDMQALLDGGAVDIVIDGDNAVDDTDNAVDETSIEINAPTDKINALELLLKGQQFLGSAHITGEEYPFNAVLGTAHNIPHRDFAKTGSGIRKALIYSTAQNDKIVDKLENSDVHNHCKIFVLHGTPKEVIRIINEFREYDGIAALIANSYKQCSGLNLQFLDTIIYYNMNNDRNCTEQGVGRGQRVGRDPTLGPLRVICLCYKEEAIVPNRWTVAK